MAKHFIMGDGKLTDEEREKLKQRQEELAKENQEINDRLKKTTEETSKVTLEQLLKTKLSPLEDRIVVWRDKAEQFTEGGLIKPREVLEKERPSRGTVIAVGPGKPNDTLTQQVLIEILALDDEKKAEEFRKKVIATTADFKPGDRIMFGRFAGTPVEDPDTGEELLIMRPADIFVKI